jgi:hypothetical protein
MFWSKFTSHHISLLRLYLWCDMAIRNQLSMLYLWCDRFVKVTSVMSTVCLSRICQGDVSDVYSMFIKDLSRWRQWCLQNVYQCVLNTTLCEKVCQWLATGRWFSSGTPVSSTNKTDRDRHWLHSCKSNYHIYDHDHDSPLFILSLT